MLYRILFIIFFSFLSSSCQQEPSYQHLSGFTMGTSYQITLKADKANSKHVHQLIETELNNVNQLMSTYINDSELSQFNQSTSLTCQPVSEQTFFVIKNAIEVSRITHGKFDATISPLISEWGFDKKQTNDVIPTEQIIQKLLKETGYQNITLGNQCVKKVHAGISINLSAIAKGYAVDKIAELLSTNNVENYLVEIGGETASKGVNPKSISWRLAIESPIEQQGQIQKIFSPLGLGVATSGDYRNYFEKDGVRYSHTIDPTNGKPITHKLVSVTVLHKQTMLADAYATAFMVMGKEQALKFAQYNKLAIYLLVKTDDGFSEYYSDSFKRHVLN